ncbi:unnamed protein product [Prunus brigantina]
MAFEDTPNNPIVATKSSASSASETRKTLEMAQPIVTVHNDISAVSFTIRLNGKNYSTWSKMMLLHVSSQEKRGKKRLSERVDLPIAKDVWESIAQCIMTRLMSCRFMN